MKVVVVGATGNVGTSVVRALAGDARVTEIVGVARRLPPWDHDKTRWVRADVAEAALGPVFAGAAAVIHLAWAIQPSRDLRELERVNVLGSRRVFRAAAEAGAGALVYASSVGAYSPGPKDRAVDESWPTLGVATSFYSRHKAEVERVLDAFEADHPAVRVVRLRPGLIFSSDAASGIRRLFAGPLLPRTVIHPALLPLVPALERLRFQAVHSHDIADAYRRAVLGDVHGAFNVAAEPVLDPPELARLLGARTVPLPARALRALVDATWRLRLQPTPPGWLDMALAVPVMDTSRARRELGWEPRHSGGDALLELIDGIRRGTGLDTPPLAPGTSGPLRVEEFRTGVGATDF